MSTVNLMIDGRPVEAEAGTTILAAAEIAGVSIPTLCHHPDLKPAGVCRICVVEVEGARTLVGSCHTPVQEGMVVHTQSAKVRRCRRTLIELMMAGHQGPCLLDEGAEQCELHRLAADLEAGPPLFRVRAPRSYPVVLVEPYLRQDLSRCILCRRCLAACSDVAHRNVLSLAWRGFASKIVAGLDDPLTTETCRDCGVCVDYCPTSALTRPERMSA
jgi:NADH dehydrogenase/NADH:ubiquinone oxidoreductase subunit G